MLRFDIERLVNDLGGPAAVAAEIGYSRTAPYGWIKRDYVSSRVLCLIKDKFEVALDTYFVKE